jgi:RHS repeat-associated protein
MYREEFFAFGETSFGIYMSKRYRYCGKEQDEESRYYNYGARMYAPWLCRFLSVDPLAGKL